MPQHAGGFNLFLVNLCMPASSAYRSRVMRLELADARQFGSTGTESAIETSHEAHAGVLIRHRGFLKFFWYLSLEVPNGWAFPTNSTFWQLRACTLSFCRFSTGQSRFESHRRWAAFAVLQLHSCRVVRHHNRSRQLIIDARACVATRHMTGSRSICGFPIATVPSEQTRRGRSFSVRPEGAVADTLNLRGAPLATAWWRSTSIPGRAIKDGADGSLLRATPCPISFQTENCRHFGIEPIWEIGEPRGQPASVVG